MMNSEHTKESSRTYQGIIQNIPRNHPEHTKESSRTYQGIIQNIPRNHPEHPPLRIRKVLTLQELI